MVSSLENEYVITIKHSMQQVLSLITRRREYFLVRVPASCDINNMPLSEGNNLCELRNESENTDSRCFLYLGDTVWSREFVSEDAYKKYGFLINLKKSGAEISVPTISELKHQCLEKVLVFSFPATDEKAANDWFVRKLLRLGVNPGQWYISDSFVDLKVMLSEVCFQNECSDKVCTDSVTPGIQGFDLWDGFLERLEKNEYGYGDDVTVLYDISCGNEKNTYFIMESYYNHRWVDDPAGLFNIRISLEVMDDKKTPEDVHFSHPTKYIRRISDGTPYFLNRMEMDCSKLDIPGYHKKLLDNQVFDNIPDFNALMYLYHHDIHLA